MCGIAGIIAPRDIVTDARLNTMARALTHRGPDDEGIVQLAPTGAGLPVVGFAHRRLSIIDLSPAGHQPMEDPDTGNWVVFNGEIYNFRVLRASLEARGQRFRTQTDTEVILKAYAADGMRCLSDLRGMFAFALWDAVRGELLLAVDRFGIKPLYVYRDDRMFLFASEVRAILASELVSCTIDRGAVESYLAFGAVQAPRTIIDGVTQILPAHAIVYRPATRTMAEAVYWRPPVRSPGDESPDLRRVLEDSVAHHLIADVPVGLFLSGGMDSSALAILTHAVAGGPSLDAFSIIFQERGYSEARYAQVIGERFCKSFQAIELTASDLLSALPHALAAMDQPTVDGINTYVIAGAVRAQGFKAVLSGQGGDELFAGYPTFKRLPRMERCSVLHRVVPAFIRERVAQCLRDRSIAGAKIATYLTAEPDELLWYALLRQLWHADARGALLRGPLELGPTGIPQPALAAWREETRDLDAAHRLSMFELRGYLGNMLVRDGDVMSMAHGLEIRVPFLDHVVLDAVFRFPGSAKTRGREPKPLLLDAVRAELPRAIYDRPKMGFTFPWPMWLRGPLRTTVAEQFAAFPPDHPLGLRMDMCRRIWNGFLANDHQYSWSRVWSLHVLMDWVQRYGVT